MAKIARTLKPLMVRNADHLLSRSVARQEDLNGGRHERGYDRATRS